MKIYLFAYTKTNLGDDLFLYILLNRYKSIDFYINIQEKDRNSKFIQSFENLHLVDGEDKYNVNIEDYDAFIYIGGSIFMENDISIKKLYRLNKLIRDCKNINIPFYYISSNFGPYYTEEYYDLACNTFEFCEDVCFRDRASKKLFEDKKSTRYAPDLVFTLNKKSKEKIKGSVGISLIDTKNREKLQNSEEQYISFLVKNICYLIEQGKKIYLYSFCEYEGDNNCSNKVLKQLPEEYKNSVIEVIYKGETEEYINLYSKMEYAICTRFHSMILSTIFRQKLMVISYSNKISNVFKELKLGKKCYELKELGKTKTFEINNYKKISYIRLLKIKIVAKKQLKKINKEIITHKH